MLRNPLLPIAIVLILGIVVGDATGDAIGAALGSWGLLMVLTLLIALSVAVALLLNSRHKMGSSIAVYLAIFFFGVALMVKTADSLRFTFDEGQPVDYEAVVMSEPKVAGKTLRCDLSLIKVNGG